LASNAKTVLVVDDEPDIRELLTMTLERMSLNSVTAADIGSARTLLAQQDFDLCLTDMQLPDGDGIDLVRDILRDRPDMPVAVITAHGSMDTAVRALKAGAFDFVAKPVRLEDLRNLIQAAMRLRASNDDSEATNAGASESNEIGAKLLGKSPALEAIRTLIAKLARSQAPVFINGESGTGKELVARLIHEQGPRNDGPFVAVNCGAVPSELMESEFFGHQKGSFTGAHADKEGFFQAAQGGTLFLDEVADLPLQMQVKLLRAIQEKAVRSIGSNKEIPVDVRILSATHKSLHQMVESGEFRQDLFYRLNVIEMTLPPLRERPEVEAFTITPEAIAQIAQYQFPGNVRELENMLERALTLCETSQITASEIWPPQSQLVPESADDDREQRNQPADTAVTTASPTEIDSGNQFEPGTEQLEDYVDRVEREAIIKALNKTRGNKTAAAKLLGITFRSLRYKLEKVDRQTDE